MSLFTATVLAGAIMTTTSPQKGHPKAAFAMTEWGSVDGKPVQLWTLDSGTGMRMRVTNYGTIITELHVPDRTGKPIDVVLGRPTMQATRSAASAAVRPLRRARVVIRRLRPSWRC